VNWIAVIRWRRLDDADAETIVGPLGAIVYHLRQHAEEISGVELTPEPSS
jgi:hypothetical protein